MQSPKYYKRQHSQGNHIVRASKVLINLTGPALPPGAFSDLPVAQDLISACRAVGLCASAGLQLPTASPCQATALTKLDPRPSSTSAHLHEAAQCLGTGPLHGRRDRPCVPPLRPPPPPGGAQVPRRGRRGEAPRRWHRAGARRR